MFQSVLLDILFLVLCLTAHFGMAYLLFRWGRKHFG